MPLYASKDRYPQGRGHVWLRRCARAVEGHRRVKNEGLVRPRKSAVEKEGVWAPKECQDTVWHHLGPLKGTGCDGGVQSPCGRQRAQCECLEGRCCVAPPRSTQDPCSIRSVNIGLQFLPWITSPQSSIATPSWYFDCILLTPFPSPQGEWEEVVPWEWPHHGQVWLCTQGGAPNPIPTKFNDDYFCFCCLVKHSNGGYQGGMGAWGFALVVSCSGH